MQSKWEREVAAGGWLHPALLQLPASPSAGDLSVTTSLGISLSPGLARPLNRVTARPAPSPSLCQTPAYQCQLFASPRFQEGPYLKVQHLPAAIPITPWPTCALLHCLATAACPMRASTGDTAWPWQAGWIQMWIPGSGEDTWVCTSWSPFCGGQLGVTVSLAWWGQHCNAGHGEGAVPDPLPWEPLAGSRMPRIRGVSAWRSCRTPWGHPLPSPLVLRHRERSWRCLRGVGALC